MSFFLVERYVPSMSAADVASAAARLAEGSGDGVRHLYTVLIPGEDTCLSLFEAPDATAVDAANERARFPADRIVEAAVFGPWSKRRRGAKR
jgi:hypothetical protein